MNAQHCQAKRCGRLARGWYAIAMTNYGVPSTYTRALCDRCREAVEIVAELGGIAPPVLEPA